MVVCALVMSHTSLFAQPMPTARDALQNVAQLSASSTVDIQQDVLSISMGTSRDGVDAGTVQNQLKLALDTALAQAKPAVAIGQLEVRTGNFSLYPRYGKDGKINGWQGSTELILEGRDFARITSTAGKIQTLVLNNVSFSLSREQRSKVESEVQALAIDRFKTKALEISKGFGFGGYTLRDVSVNINDQGSAPRPRMMAMQARAEMSDSPVSVEAGKTAVTVNVSGSVQMQ